MGSSVAMRLRIEEALLSRRIRPGLVPHHIGYDVMTHADETIDAVDILNGDFWNPKNIYMYLQDETHDGI